MQRQRGELVPIDDAFTDMGGPVQALHEASTPTRRGFTPADQVNQQLVSASERTPLVVSRANDGALLTAPAPTRHPRKSISASTASSRSICSRVHGTNFPMATSPA